MNFEIIGSSSQGNCIVVDGFLMLDCGVSYSKIKRKIKDVKIIFISHIHKDHLLPSTIKQIAYYRPNIKYICSSSDVLTKLTNCGVPRKNIFYLKCDKWYSLGGIKIKMERVVHDVENALLKWEYRKMYGIYITDTSNVDNIEAKNYDMYFIESNYREDIYKRHLDECFDEGMKKYLKRVPETHLSNEQANDFLIKNMGDKSQYVYIHESDYNYEERED